MKRLILMTVAFVMAWCCCARADVVCSPFNLFVRLYSTNLPIVWLTVDGTVQRDQRITARMKIIDNGPGKKNYTDTVTYSGQHVDYDGYIALAYRGNSSYDYSAKKPYSFRPLNRPLEAGGSWQRVSLLGMPRDNIWALLAPYNDRSLLRDVLAFEISRPWMEFVPKARFCEVIYNGYYYGVYVLTELVSKGRYRLNLEDPGEEGDELTGGYLMEVDRNDEPCYMSKYRPITSNGVAIETSNVYFQYKIPDFEDWTDAQLEYIQGRIDEMENTLVHYTFRDQETGECMYIDEMSFIDYQLAMEIGHNVDGYRLSGKFFKRRDSVDPRFKMVVWDMNFAYGNCNYMEGYRTDSWAYNVNDLLPHKPTANMVPFWWYKLNRESKYKRHLKERWAQYRTTNLRMDRLMALVDSLAYQLTKSGAEDRNSRAYPLWGSYIWPNYHVPSSFDDEIAYLKQWLGRRIVWMDSQLDFLPEAGPGDVNRDGEVTLADVNLLVDLILTGEIVDVGKTDVNGDGEVNIADVNAAIDLILNL